MEQEERTWGMVCHLASLVALIGIPFGHILGPLVVLKKDQYPFADDQGKESLNFQISMTLYGFILLIFAVVTLGLGAILLIAVFIVELVLVITAAVRANNGEYYRYPLTIQFIK
ncbi:MAG: DUF4870 domain-containing protein [Bacillota bacterium]|nr:DUF4870 domain-containing protein [Bacillota bacterium]MDW7682721.1 DUF4870 domain-containing protein [Bacillota bacterium]